MGNAFLSMNLEKKEIEKGFFELWSAGSAFLEAKRVNLKKKKAKGTCIGIVQVVLFFVQLFLCVRHSFPILYHSIFKGVLDHGTRIGSYKP